MKHLTLRPVLVLASLLASATLFAAVPLHWTVETSRAVPAQFEAYQGETLAFEAALQSYGKPLEAPSNYSLYWQTNGMGNAWWSTPCIRTFEHSEHSNILYATWSPTNDVGARVYNCFIGQPGTIYHAAFQLRLRPSPGALPNELPLPQKVIDFAKVTVLNPPWSGGGGGGVVDTNAVRDIVREQLATNGIRAVDGAARTLPKYLHELDFDDSYQDAAEEYYRSRADGKVDGGCSAVRDGGFLYRNFDYPFDDRAEFVVKMSAGPNRFASVGVAQVGTNLTEQFVVSGKPSRCYKWLPGATVDGVNENGVVAEINVVDGDPQTSGWATNEIAGALHPLAAVRWALDHATNAQYAAAYLAANIRFPDGWTQNFHYMVADETDTFIVEDGYSVRAIEDYADRPYRILNYGVVNFDGSTPVYQPDAGEAKELHPYGAGFERYYVLANGASITNAWYTRAYHRETDPPWVSDLAEVIANTNEIFDAWSSHPKEYFRNSTNHWWQTVHTSIYDITNRVLRIAVQETDDWYTFAVPPAGGAKIELDDEVTQASANGVKSSGIYNFISHALFVISETVRSLYRDKRDRSVYGQGYGEIPGKYIPICDVESHGLVKFGADEELERATEAEAEIAKVKDKADEFLTWEFSGDDYDPTGEYRIEEIFHPETPLGYNYYTYELYKDNHEISETEYTPNKVATIDFITSALPPVGIIATRRRVLRTGDAATPQELTNAISTNNPAFVSAVRSISPTPSANIRVFDEVRQCWWIGTMVNGVINWEVE